MPVAPDPAAAAAAAVPEAEAELSPALRRLLGLLRDLYAVIDFATTHVLDGQARFAAKLGKHLFEDCADPRRIPPIEEAERILQEQIDRQQEGGDGNMLPTETQSQGQFKHASSRPSRPSCPS